VGLSSTKTATSSGAAGGGINNAGAIYELKYAVGLGWTESVIYSFPLGSEPPVAVTFDNSGNLFGSTYGIYRKNDGTIFELSPVGDTWTYKPLYTFPGSGSCGPQRPLTVDAAGNLYGTTVCEGAYQKGSIFKLSNTQNGSVYKSLYDFTGGADGGYPLTNVTIDSDGNLYGTTSNGGTGNYCGGGCGVAWTIKP
jgi:uncharacterized repeat protein (TIGR03803 family)